MNTVSDIAIRLGQDRQDQLRYSWVGSKKRVSIYGGIINDPIIVKRAIISETGIDPTIRTRKREIVRIRCIYFFICAIATRKSLVKIAKDLSMNHATVIHQRRVAKNYIETGEDKVFNSDLRNIFDRIGLTLKVEQL